MARDWALTSAGVIAITTAQVLFSIALGLIALLITAFSIYVVSSTLWGNRWIRKGRS
jgi:hypothetical protein